ncbi:flagellar protein FliT [Pseudomonas typographi]|uniref:Flagellar protein FliT n=1 Tax=Pseudomonas typographi TaxID=2715964 RepID=A0ABR7YZI8_9PSED|nr:flagellar protein FliT [Pseudomonas typographi]MBD1550673.1 flagellar protein FliT [Pseudomonas typographi]MBD1586742.1 flagellar protein FliT [Pseudomonas typographi]MBD1598636.1 flagellar protein FliT [Pseudomonas typographi]
MSALQKIEATRYALVDALALQDWDAIGRLDLECRACVESVLVETSADHAGLRENLEALMGVYRQLLSATRQVRDDTASEIRHVKQASNAAKVYRLFR